MENVTCSLDVELPDQQRTFGEGWEFNIGIYEFRKISDKVVRIKFTYQDEVTRKDDDGTLVTGLTTWSENYIRAEENLQTLLDIITFEKSGVGLRIIPRSREQVSQRITSNRIEQTHQVNITELSPIKERYDSTISGNREALIDALRLNRLAANEENDGEKVGQLWGAVERLYSSEPPKVINSKEKKKEIYDLIDQATLLTDDDRARIKNTVANTYLKSKPSLVAEKFGLIGGDGKVMSPQDVKKTLDYWIGVRNIQAHGNVLMRNHDVNMLASEMNHIMETALSAEIKPSKYVIVLFRPDQVKDFFGESRKSTIKEHPSGYSSMPIHKFASFDDLPEMLRHSLADDKSEVYLVDYKTVQRITLKDAKVVTLEELDKGLCDLVKEKMKRLN